MSASRPDPVLEAALVRLDAYLARTPALRQLLVPWLDSHRARLRHGGFVPIFALPRWVVSAEPEPDGAEWDADLTYSTLCGYLFVRLVDDIVDEQNEHARLAALGLGILHNEFLKPFRERFPGDNDFWTRFDQDWAWSIDRTARDLDGRIDSRAEFERTAAAKLGACRIPVAAACYLDGRRSRLETSLALCDAIARLYQFADDVTDWQPDLAAGRSSWLLSEADSRKSSGETASEWMLREGYAWSRARLDELTAEALEAADAIDSIAAREHIANFSRGFVRKLDELEPALDGLRALADAFDSA